MTAIGAGVAGLPDPELGDGHEHREDAAAEPDVQDREVQILVDLAGEEPQHGDEDRPGGHGQHRRERHQQVPERARGGRVGEQRERVEQNHWAVRGWWLSGREAAEGFGLLGRGRDFDIVSDEYRINISQSTPNPCGQRFQRWYLINVLVQYGQGSRQ